MTVLRQRLLKYLKRLLILVVLLGAIGVGVFSWLCYWPLEGDVDNLLELVPEEVEFVLRADYDDLEGTGWVQANVLEDPLHPSLAEQAALGIEDAKRQMAELEAQINANIPLEFAQFGVVDDVMRGEVCIAGSWCRGLGPDRGPPSWKEILVMTRVSWKTRCVAALKHDFIRNKLGPRLKVEAEDSEIYKLIFPYMRVLPASQRMGCGDGFVIPPRNEWYLRRVDDVLAISNSKRLIRGVADLASEGGGGRSFAGRPGFDIELRPGRVTAAVNVEPLHGYLESAFDYYPQLKPLRRFLQPKALEKLSGSISLAGTDLLEGGGRISYIGQNAPEVQRNVYTLPERKVREGIAEFVPAEDTFAVLSLRVEPRYLLSSIVKDMLEPGDRRLWEENLVKLRNENLKKGIDLGFETLDEFFTELSTRVGTEAMVALGRLSKRFDETNFETFWDQAVDPKPAVAIMVRIKEGSSQKELEEYISSRVPLLGFGDELQRVKRKGFMFMRAALQQEDWMDFKLISPCFLLANDYLVISTNEQYMHRIIDTIADRDVPAIEKDETFRVTMATLPARGHVGLFLDLEKLSRIPKTARPEDSLPGSGTRGFLWDMRNLWVIGEKDPREAAIAARAEITARYRKSNGNRPITRQQDEAIEKEVDRRVQEHYDLYPRFEEEYRQKLEGLRRLRGIGLVLGATDQDIDANFAVVFREAESWLSWRR